MGWRGFVDSRAHSLTLLATVLMTLGLGTAEGQYVPPMAADAHPSFDVATIKPSDPADTSDGFQTSGHRIFIENETVNKMITFAFAIHAQQIVGGPDWFATERYDIRGVPDVDGQASMRQLQEMVRKLLADRFSLRFHQEKRELTVYAITVGKNGPKLMQNNSNPKGLPDQSGRGDGHHGTRTRFTNNSMADFALYLQFFVDRPVVDETGLAGKYDFVMDWSRNEVPANDPDAPPGIFTAMQEQLGLKLEPKKDTAQVMVIDHAERPSAN